MRKGRYQLVLSSVNVGDVHVVGGRAEIFVLLLGKDLRVGLVCKSRDRGGYINADQVDFGVTVLACLGGTHVDNLPKPISGSLYNPAKGRAREGDTLQGRALMRTWPPLRSAEHCMGKLGLGQP